MLLQYEWQILAICEIAAWIFTFLMAYTRYFLRSKSLFFISTILATITGFVPHLSLAILNFIKYRRISLFDVAVFALLLFGFTIGAKWVKKLDAYLQRKFEFIGVKRK